MSNLIRKGIRQQVIKNNKSAINQLKNFSIIINSMNELANCLHDYEGILNDNNVDEIAIEIANGKKLNLNKKQILIVSNTFKEETKKYE